MNTWIDSFGHWSAGMLDEHKAAVTFILIICAGLSQASEAYAQWLDNEEARKAGKLTIGSRYTAFGRLMKVPAVWAGLFTLIAILYGKH